MKTGGFVEHPRMLFFVLCFSFIGGIAFGSFSPAINMVWVSGMVFPLLLSLLSRKYTLLLFLFSVLIFFVGGILSTTAYKDRINSITLLQEKTGFVGKYTLSGTVGKPLYQNDFTEAHAFLVDSISTQSGEVVDIGDISMQLLLETPRNLTLKKGDLLITMSNIQPLYSGSLVGFERYTFFHSLAGKISLLSFHVTSSSKPTWLNLIRDRTENTIFRGFPRDVAGVLLGITIGNTELLSKNLQTNFRNSGITHILVVSGSNITFLLVFLSGILKYIPLKKSINALILILGVLLYSTLVGWDPPVIRATVMGILGYLATLRSLRISSLSLLLTLSCIFLSFSPLSLIYDPSFGLSFGATLSIIIFYRPLSDLFRKMYLPSIVADLIAITTAASIGTLPITLYHFGEISIGFFIANILIGLIIGGLLSLITWYLLLSFMGNGFLYIFGWCIYLPAIWIISVAHYIGGWGTITIPPPWNIFFISIGIILILIAIFTLGLRPPQDQKGNDHQ